MKTPTLEELLIGPQPVELQTPSGILKVYVRRLNQVERDMCTAYARRVSKDLRRKLMDPESDEHNLLVADEIAEYDIAALRRIWVDSRLSRRSLAIYRQSLEARDQTYIAEPEGDDVLPSDIEQWEINVEQAEEMREANVLQAIKSARTALEEEVAQISDETLMEEAGPQLIDNLCSDVWTTEYVTQMIARGTFKDKEATKPAFKTSDEVKRLNPETLAILSKSHMALLVDPEAVKN